MSLIPMVIEQTSKGERSFDIYSRLLRDRIIMINDEISEHSVATCVASLLFLDSESSDPIHLYVSSPGGSCYHGLSIVDTISTISAPVYTYVHSIAASMGSIIASSGDKRFMMPHATHMVHSVSSGNRGTVEDMRRHMAESDRINEMLAQHYVKVTGHTYKEVKKVMDRDSYFSATDAIEFGLADEIITSRKQYRFA